MSESNKTPENRSGFEALKYFINSLGETENYAPPKLNNLYNAQEYLKDLDLPEGFEFPLHYNGKKTMVLEDVSEEVEAFKTRNLSEQVEAFNESLKSTEEERLQRQTFSKKEKDFNKGDKISKELSETFNELLSGDPFKKQRKYTDEITLKTDALAAGILYRETCQNCTIKETPGGNTKREYLKTLNDKKTPESFFNYLEEILHREQLMIGDFKKFLSDLRDSFMTTEKAKDYEYRENYIFFMYCLINEILDNMEEITLL